MDLEKDIMERTKTYMTWKEWCSEIWDAIAFIILGVVLLGIELYVGIVKTCRAFKRYIKQMNKDLEGLWR